ncbi:MAG: hypothetical protein HQM03_04990 [Magnetococcales bacterium]|nr:hypothetical protein [Magnetococcales bacterium]
MIRTIASLLFAFLVLGVAEPASARDDGWGGYDGYSNRGYRKHHHRKRTYSYGEALYLFRKYNPCPSTGRSHGRCPGYVIVKSGKNNRPSNFYWEHR